MAELVRAFLAERFTRDLDDPRLHALVITRLEMSDDLAHAQVHVRLLTDDGNERDRRLAMNSLKKVVGRLRRGLGKELESRYTPALHFFYDSGHDNERRVAEVLAEIKAVGYAVDSEDSDHEDGKSNKPE